MPQSKTKKFSKNILKNSVVLYLVFASALINLLVFGYQRDWMSGAIFVLVAFLTTFFSKNMIVILCLAMVVANIYKYGSEVAVSEGTKEGFTESDIHGATDTNVDVNAHTNVNKHDDTESEPLDSVSYLDDKKDAKHDKTDNHEKNEKNDTKSAEIPKLKKITPEVKDHYKKKLQTVLNKSELPKDKKEKMSKQYEAMLNMAEQFSNMQPIVEQFKTEMSALSA